MESSSSVKRIVSLAEQAGVNEIRIKTKAQLNLVSENRPHQGVILDANSLELPFLHRCPSPDDMHEEPLHITGEAGDRPQHQPPILIAPDMVTDPQNIGTLMRNVLFYGCAGVIVSKSLTTPLNGIVSKASAGALEVLAGQGRLLQVKSLPRFLDGSRSNGWTVLGTHVGADEASSPLMEPIDCTHLAMAKAFFDEGSGVPASRPPLILVMGSEGEGLRFHTLKSCSHTIRIPQALQGIVGGTDLGSVDSLNVSVASGILLHTLKTFPTLEPTCVQASTVD